MAAINFLRQRPRFLGFGLLVPSQTITTLVTEHLINFSMFKYNNALFLSGFEIRNFVKGVNLSKSLNLILPTSTLYRSMSITLSGTQLHIENQIKN